MLDYKNISTTHLENTQKLLDEMVYLAARLVGLKEAANFILPEEIINSSDYHQFSQALHTYVGGSGLPVSIALQIWSKNIQKELEKRKDRQQDSNVI